MSAFDRYCETVNFCQSDNCEMASHCSVNVHFPRLLYKFEYLSYSLGIGISSAMTCMLVSIGYFTTGISFPY